MNQLYILKESQRSYRGALISHRHLQDINRHLHSTQNKGMNKPKQAPFKLIKTFSFLFRRCGVFSKLSRVLQCQLFKKKMERVPSFYKMTLIDGCNPRKLYIVRYLISLITAYSVWSRASRIHQTKKGCISRIHKQIESTSKLHEAKLL